MAFCTNCGHELTEGAKFCGNCGKAVNDNNSSGQRKTVYDGEIHKCPQCGEVINAFVSVCPSCGIEFRGTTASVSIKEFFEKIEKTTTDEHRVLLIRNYPIPNTKEDILEFMILASSNIGSVDDVELFEAWKTKFEQSYQKAKKVFDNESELKDIQILYEKTSTKIGRSQIFQTTKQAKSVFTRFCAAASNPVIRTILLIILISAVVCIVLGEFEMSSVVGMAFILLIAYAVISLANFIISKSGKSSRPQKSIYDNTPMFITIGATPNDLIGQNYRDILNRLERKGFTNVHIVPHYDLHLGLTHSQGEVKSISVNGRNSFSKRAKFAPDVEITICYHEYKSKKPF